MFLGIDFGKKRIGLAIGDTFAIPKKTVDGGDLNRAVIEIGELLSDYDIDKIVIGLPKRSQGEPGTIENEIKKFALMINDRSGLPIYFEEEQFTSSEAESRLQDAGIDSTRSEGKIDQMAAALILEQHLNRLKSESTKPDID